MADVPGRYGERMVIYHIVDEYTGYADVCSAQAHSVQQREQALIAKADLVLVTSNALLSSKGGLNPRTYWVPNAVDYDRFAEARASGAEPEELAGLPHPRLGYVGAINDKLDTDLLLHTARSFPQGTLVLVGPRRPASEAMRRGLAALEAQPNVVFVGQVPVERVPFFVAACDVGLLPYRQNAWTEHIHPLKMYEYLACGLPVVATDIPSVHDESQSISIAPDADGFVRLVREALELDNNGQRKVRQERASQNTWRHRVERISELISEVRVN
jgi:glycosyltransferase involved in cell wall biosynthesis